MDIVVSAMTQLSANTSHWAKIKKWSLRVAEFGMVQIFVQLLTAITGLLLVRTMSKQDYALLAIVNSLLSTGNLISDLGVSIGLRSIGGRVWQDQERFSSLLNTALTLRKRFAVVSMIVFVPLAAWMLWHNGASHLMVLGLSLCIIFSIIPLLASSVWVVVPGLRGEYRPLQKIDCYNAITRFTMICFLAAVWANAFSAACVGAITNWFQAHLLRQLSLPHITEGAPVNTEDRVEILRLSLKSLPNTIFFCFQGQVTFLILTLIGNPTGIADVAALGRIAMLLGIVTITFNYILAPQFMRCQDPTRISRMYWQLCGFNFLVIIPLLFLSLFYPEPLLWLLGNKYENLRSEFFWVMATGGVSQLCNAMWILNSSKAWIRFQTSAYIPMLLLIQFLASLCLDLRLFHDILIFNLLSASVSIPLCALDAYFGIKNYQSAQLLKGV